MEDRFYMQNGFVGNDILWWKKGRAGYTTDITQAHIFTKEEAVGQNKMRHEDIPWPAEYIEARFKIVIDGQSLDRAEALKGSGIRLKKPPRVRHTTGKTRHNCPNCGKIVWDHNPYEAAFCSRICKALFD
jgi:hypothetical protein